MARTGTRYCDLKFGTCACEHLVVLDLRSTASVCYQLPQVGPQDCCCRPYGVGVEQVERRRCGVSLRYMLPSVRQVATPEVPAAATDRLLAKLVAKQMSTDPEGAAAAVARFKQATQGSAAPGSAGKTSKAKDPVTGRWVPVLVRGADRHQHFEHRAAPPFAHATTADTDL